MKILIAALLLMLGAAMVNDAMAGCGKWVIRDNTDYLEDPAFDSLTAGAFTPAPSANESKEPAPATTTPVATTPAASAPVVEVPDAPDLSGRWQVSLEGEANSTISLNLMQTDSSRIMGTGDYTGSIGKVPVTVTGNTDGDSLDLNVKLVVNEYVNTLKREYRMALLYANETLSGSYDLYEDGDMKAEGNATAARAGL